MRAITFATPGAPFEDTELPQPPPPEGHDLLIRVEAISINPLDLKQHAAAPRLLGVDAAGVVLAAGSLAAGFTPGARVCCAAPPNRPGSYAEYLLADSRLVAPIPDAMGFGAAAALPCAGLTAWEALFERLRIDAGSRLLVLGGAGGVGSMAVQLAAQAGAAVTATASRPQSRDWATRLGATALLDHAGDMVAEARGKSLRFSHILATQGTARHWDALCTMLAPRGEICAIDAPGTLEMTKLRAKGAGFRFQALFAKALAQAPDMASQGQALASMAANPALQSIISRHHGRIQAAHIAVAHEELAEGHMLGKAILEGW